VPDFWCKVVGVQTLWSLRLNVRENLFLTGRLSAQLLAHPYVGANISDLDQDALFHLTRLDVSDVENGAQGYRITLVSPSACRISGRGSASKSTSILKLDAPFCLASASFPLHY
jgi:hypothetical protein